jgi:hypothetical protein
VLNNVPGRYIRVFGQNGPLSMAEVELRGKSLDN